MLLQSCLLLMNAASYKGIAKLKLKVSFRYDLTSRPLFFQIIPRWEPQFVDCYELQKTCEIFLVNPNPKNVMPTVTINTRTGII